MVVRDLLANSHGDGNCVSDGDWLDELDRLFNQNGSRSGKLRTQRRRNQ